MEQFENQNQNHETSPSGDQTPTLSKGAKFVQNYLGFTMMGLFLLSSLMLSIDSPTPIPFSAIFGHFLSNGIGIIVVGIVVATRAKGPDLSMGAMAVMVSVLIAFTVREGGSLATGIIVAAILCIFLGLLNGAIISFLGAPTIIV